MRLIYETFLNYKGFHKELKTEIWGTMESESGVTD